MTCGNCFSKNRIEQGICTACGYDSAKNREKFPLALPEGSILYGRYIIGKVLGQGGFGITYLAQDYQTQALVAIKEFFPGAMATRTGTTVTPYSGVQGENFTYGKNTFLDEAKTMAEFNGNPNIAGVQLYFEENGTAYFVMEYLDGCSFGDYIASRGGRLSWEDTAAIMFPVLEVLGQIHAKGVVHRDVSPDNIHITADGTVKLLDFGAARHSLGNVSQSLDVVVKHGFAPKEQYSRRGRQGPYTDVYAASATIYYALTGVKPDESLDRAENDTMPPPSVLNAKISRQAEDALMKGLSVDAKDRYQSAAELKNALSMNLGSRIIEKRVDNSGISEKTEVAVKEKKRSLPKWLIPVGVAAVLLLGLAIGFGFGLNKTPISDPNSTNITDPEEVLQYDPEETFTAENDEEVDGPISVGIINLDPNMSNYLTVNDEDMKETFTAENGYAAEFFYSLDNEEQIAAAQKFVQDEVDYLLISAAGPAGWDTVLKDAQDAGIKVILFDRTIDADESLYEASVVSDYAKEGQTAVDWLAGWDLDEYNIIHLQGTIGSSAQIGRSAALEAMVAENNNWNLVTQQTADFTTVWAQEIVEEVIDSGAAFNVIYAENDNMAEGAVAALDMANISHGVAGDVIIIGFDCNKWALEELLAGNWNYDVQCSPFQADYIDAIIRDLEAGKTPAEKVVIIDDKGFDAATITQEDVDRYGI